MSGFRAGRNLSEGKARKNFSQFVENEIDFLIVPFIAGFFPALIPLIAGLKSHIADQNPSILFQTAAQGAKKSDFLFVRQMMQGSDDKIIRSIKQRLF